MLYFAIKCQGKEIPSLTQSDISHVRRQTPVNPALGGWGQYMQSSRSAWEARQDPVSKMPRARVAVQGFIPWSQKNPPPCLTRAGGSGWNAQLLSVLPCTSGVSATAVKSGCPLTWEHLKLRQDKTIIPWSHPPS